MVFGNKTTILKIAPTNKAMQSCVTITANSFTLFCDFNLCSSYSMKSTSFFFILSFHRFNISSFLINHFQNIAELIEGCTINVKKSCDQTLFQHFLFIFAQRRIYLYRSCREQWLQGLFDRPLHI